MLRELKLTTPEIIGSVLISLLVLFLVIIILFGFYYFIRKSKLQIDELAESMINDKSEIIIGVKEKQVYKKSLSNYDSDKVENMNLDDFIYMISLNPESKNLRELLKLIDNGATKTQLNKKYKSLDKHKVIVTLKYSDTKASVAVIDIDYDNKTIDEYIKFQLSESFFSFKKKETFKNILDDPIETLNEHKLFQVISKATKSVRTKGWTLVKIQHKKEMLPTTKDYETNILQMAKIKYLLKQESITSFLSESGALYFVCPSGRNSNHFSIYRNWTSKIQSLLANNKNYYFDITSDEVLITTANDFVKDSRSINTTLMNVEALSELSASDKNNKKIVDEVFKTSSEIHREASALVKAMKEGPFPMMKTEYSIIQNSPKAVIEYYLDLPLQTISDITNHSFQHKRDIILLTYKEALKRSKKEKNKITTVMFDFKNLSVLSSALPDASPDSNFYLSFAEDDTSWNRERFSKQFSSLRSQGHKLIQLVRNLEDGSTAIHIAMKPQYILYTKDFSKVDDPKENIKINLAKLNTVKERQVKILNIK